MEPPATHPYDAPAAGESPPRSLFRSLRFWVPAVICLIAVVAVPIAFIIGAVLGNTQIYHNFSEHQQARIESYLSQHPDAFSVPSQDDYDNLNAKLHEMFGDELAKRMVNTVEIDTSN